MLPRAMRETWILVCDGAHAKLFVNRGPKHGVDQQTEISEDVPKADDLITGGRGRHQPPGNTARAHAFSHVNPRKMKKEVFLRNVAHTINRRAGRIRRLIVIAPPKAMHTLRESFSPMVKEKISSEVPKDLINADERSLPRYLRKYLSLRDPVNDFNYEQAKLFTAT